MSACGRKSFLDLHLAGANSLYKDQPQGHVILPFSCGCNSDNSGSIAPSPSSFICIMNLPGSTVQTLLVEAFVYVPCEPLAYCLSFSPLLTTRVLIKEEGITAIHKLHHWKCYYNL